MCVANQPIAAQHIIEASQHPMAQGQVYLPYAARSVCKFHHLTHSHTWGFWGDAGWLGNAVHGAWTSVSKPGRFW